jgi:hypothetical protein
MNKQNIFSIISILTNMIMHLIKIKIYNKLINYKLAVEPKQDYNFKDQQN